MSSYSTFSRFLVFDSLVDAISRVDVSGPVSTPSENNLKRLHAGADTVAAVSISLAREYSLTSSSPSFSLEAAFAAAWLLGESEAIRSGEAADFDAGDIRFDCTVGAGRGSAIRVQSLLPKKSRFAFHAEDDGKGKLGFFSSEELDIPLFGDSSNLSEVEGAGLLLAEREVLKVKSGTSRFDLLTLIALFQAGVDSQVFYHSMVAGVNGQEVTLVHKPESSKVSLSLVPERLFEARMG